ncbi:hypothetical protein BLNAU_11758 [Blattamonas nauphoetae]|uniref:Uncharacterized protein n=1 Tax=Blattamonas nauphoetae TaxID=2049346 RepID=A0ABQ9XQ23_9EUKA|nr:hypothetical protein BLNAU_11758 [Blattamonas nauphoetae]
MLSLLVLRKAMRRSGRLLGPTTSVRTVSVHPPSYLGIALIGSEEEGGTASKACSNQSPISTLRTPTPSPPLDSSVLGLICTSCVLDLCLVPRVISSQHPSANLTRSPIPQPVLHPSCSEGCAETHPTN